MRRLALLAIVFCLVHCTSVQPSKQHGGAIPVVDVDPGIMLQRVDGFGFSTAWGRGVPHDLMNAFFSQEVGAGFSIIRTRIPFRHSKKHKDCIVVRKAGGTGDFDFSQVNKGKPNEHKVFRINWSHWDLNTTKNLLAAIRANPAYEQPIVFSTPWTPPNNNVSQWKSDMTYPTDHPEIGGTLKPSRYSDYADVLADFVLGFEANMGVPLHALSIQNEPGYECTYESCDWTASQIHSFLKVLHRQWKKKGVFKVLPKLTIMAPEHNNFKEELILPSLADPVTSQLIGIAGGHLYEYGWNWPDPLQINFKPMKQSIAAGKRIWQTEWSPEKFGDVNTIGPNLAMAKAIHVLFAEAKLNAFVYWWTQTLVHNGKPGKTLCTLAQFSRHVRPGWRRVQSNLEPLRGVYLTAFSSPDKTKLAIILTNMGTDSKTLSLSLNKKRWKSLASYRTSAKENMVELDPVSWEGNQVTVTVPSQSITTFYGKVEAIR